VFIVDFLYAQVKSVIKSIYNVKMVIATAGYKSDKTGVQIITATIKVLDKNTNLLTNR